MPDYQRTSVLKSISKVVLKKTAALSVVGKAAVLRYNKFILITQPGIPWDTAKYKYQA